MNPKIRTSQMLRFVLPLILALLCAMQAPAFAATGPCSTGAEYRQLDFWLGSWAIHHQEGPEAAHSTVTAPLDQCLVIENWNDGKGHAGMNIFGYNPGDKAWHGMFADNRGHVHIFPDGKIDAGAAEFRGFSRDEKGNTVLNRLRIVRQSPDKVEQLWQQSSDNGATWNVVFRGEYSRATATSALRNPR